MGAYSKQKLIADIAEATSIPKPDVIKVLDQLTQLAYREAANGFVVPGICKLKVVTKKACKRRNPATGQILLIGERRALKITPLKKAKDTIAPLEGVSIQVLEAPPPQEALEIIDDSQVQYSPAPPPLQTQNGSTAPKPTPPAEDSEEGHIVFSCPECSSILSAPPKTVGQKSECPFCKGTITVPLRENPETKSQPQTVGGGAAVPSLSDFILFSCRACGQEIEAPIDMVGMDVECPTCGTNLTVPIDEPEKPAAASKSPAHASSESKGDRSSMTIRIDLSDLQ